MHYKDILESYYEINEDHPENSARKLHNFVDKILSEFGGITDFDKDECYSIANLYIAKYIKTQLEDGIEDLDEKKFDSFMYFGIKNKIKSYITKKNRGKRCKIITTKEGDKEVKQYIYPVSLDGMSTDDGDSKYIDVIPSDFNLDKELDISVENESVQLFLDSLPDIQKKLLLMKMENIPVHEIKKSLELTENAYTQCMQSIRENKMINLFNKNRKYLNQIQKESKKMENTTVKDEDLIMDIDTTDGYRMDKYTLESLIEDKQDGELDCEYISQRVPFVWTDEKVNKFYSRVLNNQPIPELIVCEMVIPGVNGGKISYLIDGLQRLSYAEAFRENRFPVGKKGAEFTKIRYRKYEYDENGKKVLDENGRAKFTIEIFDICGKYYKDLPEFLQKRFDKFNVNVTRFFDCTQEMIDYHLRNYNNHEAMSKNQYGITCVSNETSKHIKDISQKHTFMKNNIKCTNKSLKMGMPEEMVSRAIMTMKYIDDWKKESMDVYKFLDANADESDFKHLTFLLDRLAIVCDKGVKELFNTTNFNIWVAAFDKFIDYGMDDTWFVQFMKQFISELHSKKINGRSYDDVNTKNTKDKNTVKNKLTVIEDLMKEYLHIEDFVEEITEESEPETVENDLFDTEVVEESPEKPIIAEVTEYSAIGNVEIEHVEGEVVDNDTLDFVKECVDKNVTDIDVSYYEDDLNTITKDVQSKLLDDVNRKSLIAVIAYAYMQDENYEEWFENYFKRVDTYDIDQKKNYLNMRNDLITFNKGAVA